MLGLTQVIQELITRAELTRISAVAARETIASNKDRRALLQDQTVLPEATTTRADPIAV